MLRKIFGDFNWNVFIPFKLTIKFGPHLAKLMENISNRFTKRIRFKSNAKPKIKIENKNKSNAKPKTKIENEYKSNAQRLKEFETNIRTTVDGS